MKNLFSYFFILFTFLAVTANAAIRPSDIDFIWDEEPLKSEKGEAIETRVTLKLPKGYYLYAEETDLEFTALDKIKIKSVKYPTEVFRPDPLGGKPVAVFGSGDINIKIEIPSYIEDGSYELDAILHYQACTSRYCLKPAEKRISWKVNVGDVQGAGSPLPSVKGVRNKLSALLSIVKGKLSGSVLNVGFNWLLIIAFIGGILSSFTPCILPLIPITLLIIGVNPKKGVKENFWLSLLLVLGMSVTYGALGLVAAALGKSLGFLFQSRIFIILVVFFLFAMSLSLLGIYTFQLPKGLRNLLSRLGGGGYRGAFFAGISMGLLATPCVGPVVGALLLYAASGRSAALSFVLLMTYSIGLGLIIIIAGTWYGTVVSKLKKARVKWVKKLLGLLILIPAIYYLNSVIPFTQFFSEKSVEPINWKPANYSLAVSKEDSRPKMIYFTADWCPPCKILGAFTLRSPEVVELSKLLEAVKVDNTKRTSQNQMLVERFNVQGWPTIIFTSPTGKVYRDISLYGGFITKKEILRSMKETISRSKVN